MSITLSEMIEKDILYCDTLIEKKNISESKETKWTRCKVIINFLLDKGVDFAMIYLPQIIMYCRNFLK